jgi:UDP-N-acetylglucosamine--N-acetylmuramyl-(pentapeptide) pyrophosphoryl-undecaprenol N-acetylglucosamine transferase
MKVLFTGGGTAGHVTPNLALIKACEGRGISCVYIGSHTGIEAKLLENTDVPYYAISTGKLRRYFSWQNFFDPVKILIGCFKAWFLIIKLKPDVVFSKGGYVAVPVVIAARLLNVPVICHESDMTPGLANRICFPFAERICVNFPATLTSVPVGKGLLTGTPVRKSLLSGEANRARHLMLVEPDMPVMLVFGGSQGAVVINDQVRKVLEELSARWFVIHVVGTGNIVAELNARQRYVQLEFVDEGFGDLLAAADLVVARAGANSIYELLVTRKPHLLIPLRAVASRGDQIENAEVMLKLGFSRVLEEPDMTDKTFLEEVDRLWRDRAQLAENMNQFAIVDSETIILDLMQELSEEGASS